MKVPHEAQLRLLELQRIETEISQVNRFARTAPAAARAAKLRSEGDALRSRLLTLRTTGQDLSRDIERAEQDVERVRERSRRDEELLGSGVGAKMQQELAHEVQSLKRRLTELEDAELELLEQAEELKAQEVGTQAELDRNEAELTQAEAARETEAQELRERGSALTAQRESVRGVIPAELLGTYERSRNSLGIGAARFADRQCYGCRLTIPPAEAAELESAPLDELEFCEECGCILVRGT